MNDKNGIKINAGDVVRITGGYFKNSNGLFFVKQDGTNPGYLKDDTKVTLQKITKAGKISTAKYGLQFYPLKSYCNDRMKRAIANEWDAEHAEIEVVHGINRAEIKAYFEKEAEQYREQEKYYTWNGFNPDCIKRYTDTALWCETVANRI